uniref:Uncharacterized protein n=1 Tax=Aegilops tauschii subsp. strangulata TaxID=200361 RepID=A0A453JIE1_AEGTS
QIDSVLMAKIMEIEYKFKSGHCCPFIFVVFFLRHIYSSQAGLVLSGSLMCSPLQSCKFIFIDSI